ncbi:MAG: DUF4129 domain-containing protein [Alphaproteobacteria bacterium]
MRSAPFARSLLTAVARLAVACHRRRAARPRWLATLAVAALCGLAAPASMATPADEIRAAVDDVLSGTDFQRELPAGEAATPDESEPYEPPDVSMRPFDVIGPVANVLLWVVIIAAVALVAFYLNNEWRFRRERPGGADPAAPPGAPDAGGQVGAAGPGSLDDADRLAGAGRFDEAIRMLLLRSLADLRRRLDIGARPSLTAWEIVARATLPGPALSALSRIVSAAEISHFGGRPAGDEDYRCCREDYHSFTLAADGAA